MRPPAHSIPSLIRFISTVPYEVLRPVYADANADMDRPVPVRYLGLFFSFSPDMQAAGPAAVGRC